MQVPLSEKNVQKVQDNLGYPDSIVIIRVFRSYNSSKGLR